MCVKASVLWITKRLSANVLGNGVPKNWMPTYCCFMVIIKFFIWNFWQCFSMKFRTVSSLPTAVALCYVVMFMYNVMEVPGVWLVFVRCPFWTSVSSLYLMRFFMWLSLVPHDKVWVVPHIRPWPLPSTFFITHYLLAVL